MKLGSALATRRPGPKLAGALAVLLLAAPAQAQEHAQARAQMLRTIQQHAQSVPVEAVRETGLARRVLDAVRAVPRHEFVPEQYVDAAYADRPLPIGHGQTISQPFIVAFMSHLLETEAGDEVLEIGTGSGYQAAVLAEMDLEVASIEIIPQLAEQAERRLDRLGYTGIATKTGDGYYGWEARAPFDAIVVTAAASHIPPPLVDQLKPGGQMVVPVGGAFSAQQLVRVDKRADGRTRTRQLLPVRFVPLTGDH